jgi:hypothetical protein
MSPPIESRDTNAYFVRTRNESDYREIDQGVKLFGSEARVMQDGTIWYMTYRDLPKDRALPTTYIQISDTHPRGDIYAPHSRTTGFKELRINKLPDVETAIRAMDYILEREIGPETRQVTALAGRSHELLDLFSRAFDTITPEEFIQARQKTEHILHDVQLDPKTIINQEKQRITAWILKASTGQDSRERQNKLITIMALSAAYRHAVEKHMRIGPILGKFTQMREAFLFEREFDRAILTEVTDRLRPDALPGDIIFKHPDQPADRHVGVLIGLLHTTRFQLRQPHAAPYMPAGREAATIIEKISQFVKDDKRQDILSGQLFSKAHTIITKVLADNQLIYPESNG